MPPKKPSSRPSRDVLEIVTDVKRTSWGLYTTEREVLVEKSKDRKRASHLAQSPSSVALKRLTRRIQLATYQVMMRKQFCSGTQLLRKSDMCLRITWIIGKTSKMAKTMQWYRRRMGGEMHVLSWSARLIHLIICRHQWTNGYLFVIDISIIFWRWKVSQKPPPVQSAALPPWL